jgi:hypothetical protein
VGVSRLKEKGFRTGLLDIVELKIANSPIVQIIRKMLSPAFLVYKAINKPA